jgi:putative hydrolase of the HAD superfamily
VRLNQLLLLDLDDTLVDTSHVYWLARSRFIDVMTESDFNANEALDLFERIDAEHIAEFGYIPQRYVRTMLATYEKLTKAAGKLPSAKVIKQIEGAGRIVITRVPRLILGARKLLDSARRMKFDVVLVTRGIPEVQQRKLASNRIHHYFNEVRIVPRKDASVFARVMSERRIGPSATWVVGDSVRSDINPAIESGANPILYLYTHHSYYWLQEYGVKPVGPFFLARTLVDVTNLLRHPDRFRKTSRVPTRVEMKK